MTERLLALAVVAASGIYLGNALPLPQGTVAKPGAGFFPVAIGVFAILVSVVWIAQAFRRAPAAIGDPALPIEGRGRVAATAGALVGFCFLLPWGGYPAVAFVFVTLLLRWLGARWVAAVALGLATAATSYYVFGILLGVPLPRGAFVD